MCHNETGFSQREKTPLLIVISGPSGVGKDSVVQLLNEKDPSLYFVVTTTSRPPRPGEVDGVDYHFISTEEFQRMIDQGELLEHAMVYGQHKGIRKVHVQDALDSGKDVIMRLDVQGADTIHNLYPEAVLIFLTTRSEEELIHRLEERKSDTPDQLKIRIETARHEYTLIEDFDYEVVNADGMLEEAVDTILTIIHAEHHRTNNKKITL